jgi:lysyl-tRNA synthetase class 2
MEGAIAGEPMSKSALKKLEKAKKAAEDKRVKEEKKREANADRAPRAASAAAQEADDEDMDPTQYRTNRLRSLGELKEKSKNPYPHKFAVSTSIPQYIQAFSAIQDGEHLESKDVSVAGNDLIAEQIYMFFYL